MNNKFIIVIIVVIAVIVFGGIYFMTRSEPMNNEIEVKNQQNQDTTKNNEPQPIPEQPMPEEKKEIKVTYTDSGFSPELMNIEVGETVIFKNESAKDMWVASAPHPTHTVYPEFDAKKAYKKGESYSFTFTKKGEWKYHNHLNSSQRGTVVVDEGIID